MKSLLRKTFRNLYYSVYGKNGKRITINNEPYVVSAHIARGVKRVVDEPPYNILKKLIDNAEMVFDIGANLGIISLLCAKQMKGGTIYAFEPTPSIFKVLADNARVQDGNAKIYPMNLAVGSGKSNLYFKLSHYHTRNLIVSGPGAGVIEVSSISIDEFCKENNVYPQVMKIDVEGWEYETLKGMRNILKENNCNLMIEMHQELLHTNGVTREMFNTLIRETGYYAYNSKGEITDSPFDVSWILILSKTQLSHEVFNP